MFPHISRFFYSQVVAVHVIFRKKTPWQPTGKSVSEASCPGDPTKVRYGSNEQLFSKVKSDEWTRGLTFELRVTNVHGHYKHTQQLTTS